MKTNILPALIALGMLISSGCKKDDILNGNAIKEEIPVTACDKNMEQILLETDKKYGTNYSGTHSKGGNLVMEEKEYTRGIYYIPQKGPYAGDPTAGYCLPCPEIGTCICFIHVYGSGNRKLSPTVDVILNAPDSPYLIKDLKEVKTHDVLDDNGNVLYTTLEYVK